MPKVLATLRALVFGSAGSEAISVGVAGDSQPRLRIDAGGRLTWGSGAQAGDVYAERNGANTLLVSGELVADSYAVDTSATTTGAIGKLIWNDTEGTLDLGLKGGNVSLPVGQSLTQRVSNVTGSGIPRGRVVRLSGAQGNRTTVALATAASEAGSSKTFGVTAEEIADNHSGFVLTEGLLTNLDTSALTEGAIVWLSASTPGVMTTTRPTAPNHGVMVGLCVKSHVSTGILLVKVQNGYELEELHNVLITTPTNGQVLTYDAALALWKNANATGGGGGASVSVGDTAPASPSGGDLWFNSDNLKTYIYYDSFWVEVGGDAGGGQYTVSDIAPTSPGTGDVWYDSTTGKQYIYYDLFWVEMTTSNALSVSSHGTTHIRGGNDVIDGDRLQVDYVPTAYTRDTASPGAGAATDLTAHLGGIDDYLMSATGRNRAINGGMMVDQRNSGAAISYSGAGTSGLYAVDRYAFNGSGGGSYTIQRVQDGPPSVSAYSWRLTVGATPDTSLASTDNYLLLHRIEGFNVADLGFGTANPQPLTLSFYVKSSVTGTFSVGFNNGAYNRSYVAAYTINAANTWERKSISLTADTTGTWAADNTLGLSVNWTVAMGSAYTGTAGTWTAGTLHAATGQVNLMATTGATFQLTGVQLEYGTAPTRFEVRAYDEELRRCQRYFERYSSSEGSTYPPQSPCNIDVANRPEVILQYQRKRTSPAITVSSGTGFGFESLTSTLSLTTTGYSGTLVGTGPVSANLFFTGTWTAYVPAILLINSNQYIDISAEL